MRLRRFYIDRHLLLRDLDLRFDRPGRLNTGQYALDFLVGVNGSGKSTVLRALAQVIADLRADRTTDFNYVLEYELQGRDGPYLVAIEQTRIGAVPQKRMRVWLSTVHGEPLYDSDAIDQGYLPSRVVVYTTGSEAEWELVTQRAEETSGVPAATGPLLADPVQRVISELPGHLPSTDVAAAEEEAKQYYLLIRASRLPVVTLCGLLAHLATSASPEQRPLKEVLTSIGLQHVRGFSLRFRIHRALSPRETFDRLQPFATRHIQQGTDHLLVFDLSTDDFNVPSRLLKEFNGSLNLFEEFDRLQNESPSGQPTLQQVNLFLERDIPSPSEDMAQEGVAVSRLFLFDWLSDGEQSFLGRMALLTMLDTEDSLILLDEPEVHFNDYWKREIVNLLDIIMQAHSNHLLIATHSSIVLSDVTESHIISLVRSETGWAEHVEFDAPTFGADPSSIMVHVFGTGSAVGAFSAQYLAAALDRNNVSELKALADRVGIGYWYFRILNRLEKQNAS
jgi:energy-coupling factor transporter ATP-binding protein EcfA2